MEEILRVIKPNVKLDSFEINYCAELEPKTRKPKREAWDNRKT